MKSITFNFGAALSFEKIVQKPLTSVFSEMMENKEFPMETVLTMYQCGRMGDCPDINRDQALKELASESMSDVIQHVVESIGESFGTGSDEESTDETADEAGNSTSSSSNE